MSLTKTAQDVSGQIGNAVIDNPKIALLVPTVTASIAPLTQIAEIQGYLSIISMIVGIVISLILLRHRIITLRTAEIELKEAENRQSARGNKSEH